MFDRYPHSLRVLGIVDGPLPPLEATTALGVLGVRLEPYVELPIAGPTPRLLLGSAADWRVRSGLTPPFSGFIESDPRIGFDIPAECVEAAVAGGFGISVRTRTVFDLDVAARLTLAVAQRLPDDQDMHQALELALYEVIGNAAIHGNLGIESHMRGSAETLATYQAILDDRLDDPRFADKRVMVTVVPQDGAIEVTVSDQGDGYDLNGLLARPASLEAKSGRGLGFIRQLAQSMAGRDGGRTLVMTFACRE